jgi:peptidylprolyl isomerase
MRKALYPTALALLLLGAVLPAGTAGAASSAAGTEVVAKVGAAELTVDEVRTFLDALPQPEQEALIQDPAKLSQAVRLYLGQRMIVKEAQAKKFDQQADVKARLERVKEAALAEFYLQSAVKLPDGFPSEAELQAAYDANKSAFLAPRQYHLAQIFLRAPKGDKAAEDAGKAKLDDALKTLKAKGADFAAVAHETSESNAETGGDIGWVAENQLVPEIRAVAAALAKDAVSDPLRLDDGWHLVKLLDTKPAGILSLAEVKPALVDRMRQAKVAQLRQAYMARLLQKDPPVLNEMALAKISAKK